MKTFDEMPIPYVVNILAMNEDGYRQGYLRLVVKDRLPSWYKWSNLQNGWSFIGQDESDQIEKEYQAFQELYHG